MSRFMATRMTGEEGGGSREAGLEELLLPHSVGPVAAGGRRGGTRKISCSRTVSERSSGVDPDEHYRPKSRRLKSPSPFGGTTAGGGAVADTSPLHSPKKFATAARFRKLRHSSSDKSRKISSSAGGSKRGRRRTNSSELASDISEEEADDNAEILAIIQAESDRVEKERRQRGQQKPAAAIDLVNVDVTEVTATTVRAVRLDGELNEHAAAPKAGGGWESDPGAGGDGEMSGREEDEESDVRTSSEDELKELYIHYTRLISNYQIINLNKKLN